MFQKLDKYSFQAPAYLMKSSEEKIISKIMFLLKMYAKYL